MSMYGAIAQSAREDRLVATISASVEDTTFIWRDINISSKYKYRYQLESSTTESIEFEITGSPYLHVIDFGQSGSHKLFLKPSGSGAYTHLPKIDFHNSTSANRAKLQSIDNWGNCSFYYDNDLGFSNCRNMDVLAPDVPLYYGERNASSNYHNSVKSRWFMVCDSLKNHNHSLKNIDFSNTSNAYSFFQQTYSLDGGIDLSTYDTSKFTTLYAFFYGCPISSSASSSVVNSHGRTYIAWDTSNVTNMAVINAGVDQAGENYGHPTGSLYGGKIKGIGNWNTSNVTNLTQAFRGAPLSYTGTRSSSFNEDINTKEVTIGAGTPLETTYNAWDVSSVQLFGSTTTSQFNNGTFFNSAFNQPLNNWQINSSSLNPYLHGLFCNCKDFNQPISESVVTVGSKTYRAWDVSKVVSFRNMFYNPGHGYFVPAFNQDIGNWNVISGSDFANMFQYHYGYNQDLSKWNTVNATNMGAMFRGTPLRYNLSSSYQNHPERGEYIAWDTSKVDNMAYMFQHNWTTIAGPHQGFNQDINNWNTSNVTVLRGMFGGATSIRTGSFNQDISTKQVTIGAGTSVETTYNAWDVSSVTQFGYPGSTTNAQYNAQGIFAYNSHFNQPIGNWQLNTGSALWTRDMFYTAFAFNQDISESIQTVGSKTYRAWDMRKSQGLTYMFFNAHSFDKDIGNWNISSSRDLRATFYRSNLNQDLSKWNTMNVIEMSSTFDASRMHDQDLSSSYQPATSNRDEYIAWDTSKVTTMAFMFRNYINPSDRQPGFIGNVNNWDTSNVTSMKAMFAGYYNASNLLWTASFNQDISTKQVTIGAGTSLERTYNAWDVSSVRSFAHTNTTNEQFWYHGMFAANRSFNQPIGNWQIYTGSGDVQTQGMFYFANAFNQDISSSMVTVGSKTYRAWDTQRFINGRVMFSRATAFNKPIGNWDMTNLLIAKRMFYVATSFNQDISASAQTVGPYDYNAWYMPNNVTFVQMFEHATSFNKSLSTWYVSGSTSFSSMFAQADALSDASFATQSVSLNGGINYTSWDFNSNGAQLNNMFRYADNFEGVGLNTWDTSNITTFGDAFAQTTNITTANYDKILTSWSSSLGSVGQLNFGDAQYTGTPGSAPSASHVFIEDDLGITLTDGGPA